MIYYKFLKVLCYKLYIRILKNLDYECLLIGGTGYVGGA